MIFRIDTTDERGEEKASIERMRVTVKGRVRNLYAGQLYNDPYYTGEIQAGIEVCFLPNHVIDICE